MRKGLDLGQVGTKRLSWLVGALSPVSYIGLEIELVRALSPVKHIGLDPGQVRTKSIYMDVYRVSESVTSQLVETGDARQRTVRVYSVNPFDPFTAMMSLENDH